MLILVGLASTGDYNNYSKKIEQYAKWMNGEAERAMKVSLNCTYANIGASCAKIADVGWMATALQRRFVTLG